MYQSLKSDDNNAIARLVVFHFISTLIKNLSREFFQSPRISDFSKSQLLTFHNLEILDFKMTSRHPQSLIVVLS